MRGGQYALLVITKTCPSANRLLVELTMPPLEGRCGASGRWVDARADPPGTRDTPNTLPSGRAPARPDQPSATSELVGSGQERQAPIPGQPDNLRRQHDREPTQAAGQRANRWRPRAWSRTEQQEGGSAQQGPNSTGLSPCPLGLHAVKSMHAKGRAVDSRPVSVPAEAYKALLVKVVEKREGARTDISDAGPSTPFTI